MDYEIFVTPGLGDNSYLIASHGEAVIVDPQRDVWRFLAVAEAKQWRIRYVLETHVHNDYLSGALEVRRATGAEIGAPARGGYAFPHVTLADGDTIQVGALRCIALETPVHTWEHTAYAVHEDTAPDPAVVLTGGSLRSSGRAMCQAASTSLWATSPSGYVTSRPTPNYGWPVPAGIAPPLPRASWTVSGSRCAS